MAKVSVLIPVYNVEPYLEDCLKSVINQTESDIEIVCVDDASNDNSLHILTSYAQKDTRITILKHNKNQGLCKTRKDAVEVASGEYIMFLDSDDFLSLDACEKLYKEIYEKQVDILQFGTELLPNSDISDDMIKWVTDFVKPSVVTITDADLVSACFLEHKFNCNLWNKIWRTDICKRAYSYIKNDYCVSAEDRYATFLLAYFSRSYSGTLDIFYHYRLGVGITGGNYLTPFQFESRCRGAGVVQNIRAFLEQQHKFGQYQEVFKVFENEILDDCIDCWHNKLLDVDYHAGYLILLKYWGSYRVIGAIGKRYFEEQQDIYSRCIEALPKSIAIYYRYMGYPAMDNVIKRYITLLKNDVNSVILLTDDDAPENSNQYMGFPLIHIFSATNANWNEYQKRCNDWLIFLKQNDISIVYYLSPTSHVAKLDELTICSLNKKFINCLDEYIVDEINQLKQTFSKTETELADLKNKIYCMEKYKWSRLLMKLLYKKALD